MENKTPTFGSEKLKREMGDAEFVGHTRLVSVRMEYVRHLFLRVGKCPTRGRKMSNTSFEKLGNEIFDWNTAKTLIKKLF